MTSSAGSYLVHHQALHLALQHLHARRGDDGAHVGHHALAQDLADQPGPGEAEGRGMVSLL
ncbi:hypothetical protein EYF80_051724 [Liparis tanakae]|uniref:Uncharacterized protein n=1 Tax=Liparis tanakae TaxID=230148 RepID=A0A4Z2FCK7_9TELE|nr:hypothetical protein EYF80_051724 [Liparis tanakae]